ncbi:MAG: M20/M25/M40 family metallo-hydrolase [Alphaproteobacteria bacterium]|jgi:acetylornithine deacetylase/succinyl-diaminopimelate desuccinylase-like protein
MKQTLTLLFLLATPAAAETLDADIAAYVDGHQKEIVTELLQAVSIPSVAADRKNARRKAEFLQRRFSARGFSAELLETDGNPLVWAERKARAADRTLLLYMHYDGQPVDPTQWSQDDPFRPVLRSGKLGEGERVLDIQPLERFEDNWRIYARSISDDTAPIFAVLAAIDGLEAAGVQPTVNLRVVLDGEEEAGSPSLVPAIDRYRDKLGADLMLIFDGPRHASGRPTVVYGARGILALELTVYGPKFPLHSGHYGNWAPNPALRLAQLLASMKDEQGRVVIEGFYDGIDLDAATRRVLDAVPDNEAGLKQLFGISQPDAVGATLQEAIQYPSLNIRGVRSAWVGSEARTIVPDTAVAAIDVRLVKETPPEATLEKILRHVRNQGYYIVDAEPDDATRAAHGKIVRIERRGGTKAFRTDLDDPLAQGIVDALSSVSDAAPVKIRTSGGTVPISPFIGALGFPALSVPTVNFDNNQHSPNENLRLGHFFESIVMMAAIMTSE